MRNEELRNFRRTLRRTLRPTGRAAPARLRGAAAALLAVTLVDGAAATSLREVSLADRVVRADLIADMTVVSVATRLSTAAGPEEPALPHTFVTFRVDRRIKGDLVGDTVTLRFLGGEDGQGLRLDVAGIPTFEVGDREILFVQGNGERMCPLVGWEQGRFRVVADEVYGTHGQELWVAPGDQLLLGENRLKPAPIDEADDADHEERERFEPPAGALRPDARGLAEVLERMTAEAILTGRTSITAARSVDPGASFRARLPVASAAPPAPDDVEGPLFRGDRDPREEAELRVRLGGR